MPGPKLDGKGAGEEKAATEKHSFLVFEYGKSSLGTPLHLIARIEEIQAGRIEKIAHRLIVQYHQRAMQLIALEKVLTREPNGLRGKLYILVLPTEAKPTGIIATRSVNAADLAEQIDNTSVAEKGVTGSAQSLAGRPASWASTPWPSRLIRTRLALTAQARRMPQFSR